MATATGWGTLKEDGKPSCILQEVEVPILANAVCTNQTNYTSKMITDNMLCAGYPGVGKKDSCQVIIIYKRITNFVINIFLYLIRVTRVDRWSHSVTVTNGTSWSEWYRGAMAVLDQHIRECTLGWHGIWIGCGRTRRTVASARTEEWLN